MNLLRPSFLTSKDFSGLKIHHVSVWNHRIDSQRRKIAFVTKNTVTDSKISTKKYLTTNDIFSRSKIKFSYLFIYIYIFAFIILIFLLSFIYSFFTCELKFISTNWLPIFVMCIRSCMRRHWQRDCIIFQTGLGHSDKLWDLSVTI